MTEEVIAEQFARLSPTGQEILRLHCQGLTVKEIVKASGKSEQRVYRHLAWAHEVFDLVGLNGYERLERVQTVIAPVVLRRCAERESEDHDG